MTPILYQDTETQFDSNGLGMLSDAISCKVTFEGNGIFELEMEYPITGIHYSEMALRGIIAAPYYPFGGKQPFRIYQITKPISGIVTVYAQHISYDLSGVPVSPFSASSAAEAITKLKQNAAVANNFVFWADSQATGEMDVKVPTSTRSLLGGTEGSLLDVYGGEYEFDVWTVKLHSKWGQDSGATIEYGKNLTDLQQEENIANVATGVYPYYTDSDGNVMELPEKIVNAPGTYNFVKIIAVDLPS